MTEERQGDTVRGMNGQVEFDWSFVTIRRKGILARAMVGAGEKRIPVSSISAVQLKPAGLMSNGYIQFTVPGGNEVRSRFGSETRDASGDENSVVFTKGQQPAFVALRDAVVQAIHERQTPHRSAAPAVSLADELAKLAALRDQGVLTDEEFAAQKTRLIG